MKKKIQQKLILFAARIIGRPVLLLYRRTLHFRVCGQSLLRELRARGQNFLLASWHEYIFPDLFVNEGQGLHALVSRHFDGEVITQILKGFRLKSIRGSSTRGGKEAYRQIKERMLNGRLAVAFTPDGPTGPRRKAKAGVVRLASETGAPIIPMAAAATRYRRLGSWDRFLLILPFSKCSFVYGKPLYVPPGLDRDQIARYIAMLEERLNQLDKEAQKCLPR